MNNLNIRKSSLSRISNFILALLYGFFIFYLVQVDLENESGDIGSLLAFFKNFNELNYFNQFFNITESVDYTFRYILIFVYEKTKIEFLNLLSLLALIISSLVFFIFALEVNQRNKPFYLYLLFLMIFFTPSVWDLWASGIRSGFAFVLLFTGLIYFNGTKRYIMFLGSVLIHLSMIPFIALYFLYNFLISQRHNIHTAIFYLSLLFFGLVIILLSNQFYTLPPLSQSIRYQLFILMLALVFIFFNTNAVRDLFGFISIGIIFIVLFGFVFDSSFIRYVGNFIVIFLFYLINKGDKKSIQLTCFFYFPYFFITLYYSIINLI
jgi:hypothetical protein